jgi:DnaJ-like protein
MARDSKLFDGIRIKRRSAAKPESEAKSPCAWQGCERSGAHRAPKGHNKEGAYYMFCLEHVRAYNKSFNYFSGMKENEVQEFMKNSLRTGERPTWKVGAGQTGPAKSAQPSPGKPAKPGLRDWSGKRLNDPFNVFARYARAQARSPVKERERTVLSADRNAIEMLGLEGKPDAKAIKSAYKDMVKRHHPDANGGDKESEERLRNIIVAFNHLKDKGFV